MRAILCETYGPSEVLHLAEVPETTVSTGDVRVRSLGTQQVLDDRQQDFTRVGGVLRERGRLLAVLAQTGRKVGSVVVTLG